MKVTIKDEYMESTRIKIKGSDIISRWNNANGLTKKLGSSNGEKGAYFRQHGYDVWSDCFNYCHFGCKDINLSFTATNRSDNNSWVLSKSVVIYNYKRNNWETWYIENEYSGNIINPDEEYEFDINLSLFEKLESGIIEASGFKVATTGKRSIGEWHYFNTFEEADEFAQKMCQKYIDRRFNDRSCQRYYMASVKNDVQKAREGNELRHYTWYDYNGYEQWIVVIPID